MNIQNLRENFPKLIAFMQENSYSSEYVARLRREVNFVLTNADVHKWESYRDVYDYHTTQTDSAQVLRDKLTRLGIIERFDLRSEFPDGLDTAESQGAWILPVSLAGVQASY